MFYYQDTLINIILGQSSDRVIDFLEDVAIRSSFLPLSFSLMGFKPDISFVYISHITIFVVVSKAKSSYLPPVIQAYYF